MITMRHFRRNVLAVMHNMVLGMSYIVQPVRFASREVVDRVRKGSYGDFKALQRDWQMVGRDIQVAIFAFEREMLDQ